MRVAAEYRSQPEEATETRILPFRGGEGRVPSPVLVRQVLAAGALGASRERAAMAVAAALGEGVAGDEQGLIALPELVRRTALSRSDVAEGVAALEQAGALTEREGRYRLDPDLYCTLPVLAAVEWEGVRRYLERGGGRRAPALAVLREVARQSRRGAGEGGEWLQPAVRELVEETRYGRTAVTQALTQLAAAGLLEKVEQAARHGLRLRLTAAAFGGTAAAPAAASGRSEAASQQGRGVDVQIGGAILGVPAGSRLELPAGMNYRLDLAPDGRAIIRVDD